MDEGRDLASLEEMDLFDDDEVFIKDLDSSIVHKLVCLRTACEQYWSQDLLGPLLTSSLLKAPAQRGSDCCKEKIVLCRETNKKVR